MVLLVIFWKFDFGVFVDFMVCFFDVDSVYGCDLVCLFF